MILKSVSRSVELTSELSDKACFRVSASIGRIRMMLLSDSVKDVMVKMFFLIILKKKYNKLLD